MRRTLSHIRVMVIDETPFPCWNTANESLGIPQYDPSPRLDLGWINSQSLIQTLWDHIKSSISTFRSECAQFMRASRPKDVTCTKLWFPSCGQTGLLQNSTNAILDIGRPRRVPNYIKEQLVAAGVDLEPLVFVYPRSKESGEDSGAIYSNWRTE